MKLDLAKSELKGGVLTRVTLSYGAEEDRIQMTGLLASGVTIKLWLTQRLVNQLVCCLLKLRLDEETPSCLDTQGSNSLTFDNFALNQSPVECDENTRGFLIQSVDVSQQSDLTVLVFKGSDSLDTIALPMKVTELKKWLFGLRQCYRSAHWPQSVWVAGLQLGEPHSNLTTTFH